MIYFLHCECEWEGVVTDVMYIVYACVLGCGQAIFHWCTLFGTLFCYVGGTWSGGPA